MMPTRKTGRRRQRETNSAQSGFAIVVVLVVIVILTLLSVSLALMADTENRIATNERLSAQALYAAETATRMVKRWFDQPMSPQNLSNPGVGVVDRSLRLIDADGDPSTAALVADGSVARPYYKQGVDLDGDGADDLFEKPYRGSLVDTLLGTEIGPDLRIDEHASAAARTYLRELSRRLFDGYPGGDDGLAVRISRIDVYAPPRVWSGGAWVRHGIATVKAIARVYQALDGGSELAIGERMVRVVLNEIPYNPRMGLGALHSCDALTWNGEFTVHWGLATAVSATDLHNNHDKLPVSLARVLPPDVWIDLLWGHDDDVAFAAYKDVIDGLRVEDPWLRVFSGGQLAEAPTADVQPWPFTWIPGTPLDDGDLPYHPGPPGPNPYPTTWDGSHSNVFQNTPVGCPEQPYELWKSIATSGSRDVHYYVWVQGDSFSEDGVGPVRTFRSITDEQSGLFFFDTADGMAPLDADGDGEFDNLSPAVHLSGGRWGVQGMVYLNAMSFSTQGIGGRPVIFNAPGEPFQDRNQNGRWDLGEDWINLSYPTRLDGLFAADSTDTLQDDGSNGGVAVRNARGPDIDGEALVWGILYNNGYYDATGNGTYYGSVISKQGIGELSPAAGTPHHYWDESLRGAWPPQEWDLPRVTITHWETDM